MSAPNNRTGRLALGLSLVAILAGCAVGPDFQPPAPPVQSVYLAQPDPTQTQAAAGQVQHFLSNAPAEASWWHSFKSPQLDALIDQALAGNPALAAAQASLRQSQHDLRSFYGVFFPEIDAGGAASREKYSATKVGGDAAPTLFNLFTLSASVSYVVDVAGGNRRQLEALGAAVDLAAAEDQATALTLIANVVNSAIASAAYRDQIASLQGEIDAAGEQLFLAELQGKSGLLAESDLIPLRSQLASARAALPPLQQKLAQSEHLLASLVGKAPAEWSPPALALSDLTLPETLPIALPSEMVRHRPDILAAEASLHAASANIGVATAALFPSLTLSGSYGANSNGGKSLFAANGQAGSFGATVTVPIFEGGSLWYRRQAAIDLYQQTEANYRAVVLAAFVQVADSLKALDNDARTLQADQVLLDAARQNTHLAEVNYQAGRAPFAIVLIARIAERQSEMAVIAAKAMRLQDSVALVAALGGGWGEDRQPR